MATIGDKPPRKETATYSYKEPKKTKKTKKTKK